MVTLMRGAAEQPVGPGGVTRRSFLGGVLAASTPGSVGALFLPSAGRARPALPGHMPFFADGTDFVD